jgi:hypothetical protein
MKETLGRTGGRVMGVDRAQAEYLALKANGIVWFKGYSNAIWELAEIFSKILEVALYLSHPCCPDLPDYRIFHACQATSF